MDIEREPKRQRPGPKTGIVYEYFTPEGRYDGSSKRTARKCNACGDVIPAYKAKAEELVLHLHSRCQAISPEARAVFTQRHALELGAKAAISAREACDDEDSAPSFSTDSAAASSKGGTASRARSVRQRGKGAGKAQTSIRRFTDSAMPKDTESLTNQKLALFFIMNKIPFDVVEDPYFLDLLYTLDPTYNPPGREALAALAALAGAPRPRCNSQALGVGNAAVVGPQPPPVAPPGAANTGGHAAPAGQPSAVGAGVTPPQEDTTLVVPVGEDAQQAAVVGADADEGAE